MSVGKYGRYQLETRVGVGGMAEVFLGRDTVLGRRVAVKTLLPRLASDPTLVAMFLDEARATATLDHPNIVRVFDVGQQEVRYFLVMEWLEGLSLREILGRLRGERLPVGVVCRWMVDACQGIDAAHEAETEDGEPLNLVHRDITPHNLFVTESGLLKVVDFGVAQTAIQWRTTCKGVVRGKLAYMSPEHANGDPVDRRADIFSLGVVLHELLTGERLLAHQSVPDLMRALREGHFAPPTRPGEPLEEALVRATMRAIEADRERRFPTARAFGDALRRFATEDDSEVKAWLERLVVDEAPDTEVLSTATVPPETTDDDDGTFTDRLTQIWSRVTRGTRKRGAPHHRWRAAVVIGLALLIAGVTAMVTLAPDSPATGAPTTTEGDPASPPAPAEARVEPTVPAPPKAVRTRRARTKRKATGLLTLQADPWANVYINGKRIGMTPLIGIRLPAGRTVLRLHNPETGDETRETITIPADGHVRRTVRLASP